MFKFIAVFAFVATASALSPHILNRFTNTNTHASSHHTAPSQSHASSDDVHAETKYFDSDVHADGFHYAVETTNHIRSAASGDEHGNIHGDFEWISPEGEHVKVTYVADENGYQPNSDLLPTPPPVPEAILKSLEYIHNHPAQPEHHGKHY